MATTVIGSKHSASWSPDIRVVNLIIAGLKYDQSLAIQKSQREPVAGLCSSVVALFCVLFEYENYMEMLMPFLSQLKWGQAFAFVTVQDW